MSDMSAVIVPKSDQINADDLIAGPMTIRITEVKVNSGQEQPVSVAFEGSKKLFRPCKSMCRVMVNAWGPDASKYAGRSLTLYRDASVTWGALAVGGIRISHMTDIERDMVMALTEKKGSRKPFIVKPLKAAPAAPQAATEDKAAEVAASLIDAITGASTRDALEEITASKRCIDVRARLTEARPELAAKVGDAVAARLAAFDAADAEG